MNRRQVYNPFLPLDEYIPDGEPHVFDGRVYLFGSHDREGGTEYCELDYVVYSAPEEDLSDWKCDGVIYRAAQDPAARPGSRLYAPDVVRGNDGRYYLYYAFNGFDGSISVAVCDEPAGRYEYYGFVRNPDGSRFRRFIPGDPALMNDGGVIRLYYGWALSSVAAKAHLGGTGEIPPQYRDMAHRDPAEGLIQAQMMMFHRSREEILREGPGGVMGAVTVTLADDMLTVNGEPLRIVPGDFNAAGTGFEGHAFYEASSIRKIDGVYYFIYSSMQSHELCYATSRSPDSGFVYGGTIISNGDVGYHGRKPEDRLKLTGNNHGSIEKIKDRWYVFYHRQTHSSTFSRQACAEPVVILPDGSIPQVEMTSCGLNNGPLRADGEYPAVIACNLTNGHMPHITNRAIKADIPFITHGSGADGVERYITGVKDGVMIGCKRFFFEGPVTLTLVCRGTGSGVFSVRTDTAVLGEIAFAPSAAWRDYSARLDARGVEALYFDCHGTGETELKAFRFET